MDIFLCLKNIGDLGQNEPSEISKWIEINILSVMKLDIVNFENFSQEEYIENLFRLNINNYSDLVGKEVYYVKPIYGKHKILQWNPNKGEYLLCLDDDKFWSNPFKIKII